MDNKKIEEAIKALEEINIKIGDVMLGHRVEWIGEDVSAILSTISILKLLSVSKEIPEKKRIPNLEVNTHPEALERGKIIGYNLCHDEFTAWIVGRMEEIEKVIKSSELNADARAWQVEAYSDKFGTIDYVKGEEHSKRTIDNLATAIKTMILGGEG